MQITNSGKLMLAQLLKIFHEEQEEKKKVKEENEK
jgi:hypothetical protein